MLPGVRPVSGMCRRWSRFPQGTGDCPGHRRCSRFPSGVKQVQGDGALCFQGTGDAAGFSQVSGRCVLQVSGRCREMEQVSPGARQAFLQVSGRCRRWSSVIRVQEMEQVLSGVWQVFLLVSSRCRGMEQRFSRVQGMQPGVSRVQGMQQVSPGYNVRQVCSAGVRQVQGEREQDLFSRCQAGSSPGWTMARQPADPGRHREFGGACRAHLRTTGRLDR